MTPTTRWTGSSRTNRRGLLTGVPPPPPRADRAERKKGPHMAGGQGFRSVRPRKQTPDGGPGAAGVRCTGASAHLRGGPARHHPHPTASQETGSMKTGSSAPRVWLNANAVWEAAGPARHLPEPTGAAGRHFPRPPVPADERQAQPGSRRPAAVDESPGRGRLSRPVRHRAPGGCWKRRAGHHSPNAKRATYRGSDGAISQR